MRIVAGLDIGSGATKIVVAEIKSSKPYCILEKILYEKETELLLAHDTEASGGMLSAEMRDKCKNVLRDYRKIANELGANTLSGVATQVFRSASNGSEFLSSLREEEGIEIECISQEREAMLGYLTAVSLSNGNGIISWDSGGASFQISNGKTCFEGPMGSSVVTAALCRLQGKTFSQSSSPNPVSISEATMLRNHIESTLRPLASKDPFLPSVPQQRVVAIGGETCAFNMCKQAVKYLGGSKLQKCEIDRAIESLCDHTDQQLISKGFSLQPTMILPKLILVSTVMQIVGLSEIEYFQSTGSCLGVIMEKYSK